MRVANLLIYDEIIDHKTCFNFIYKKSIVNINNMSHPSSLVINPQSKNLSQLAHKTGIVSIDMMSYQQILAQAKIILLKSPDSRNNTENKFLNKFSKRSNFFSAIAQNAAPDVAQAILKHAHIYQIAKNRTIVSKGEQVQKIIVLLQGKFGIVDSGQPVKSQLEKQQSQIYKKIIDNSLKVSRDLKRRIKDVPQDPNQILQFKTTKATMFDLSFKRFIQNQEQVFNVNALVTAKKYSQTIVTCKNSIILAISSKVFYQCLSSYVKKIKSQKISAFRKFQYFNCVQSQRLIQIVDELPLVTMKKGQYVYKQGQQMKHIYLLIKGSIKLTKTADLFIQNPNLFYMNREKIEGAKKLPFANFSEIYNYKPRKKLLQLGITNQLSIFGQQEFFSPNNLRQTNAQINSQTAVFYLIEIQKLEENLYDIKGFMSQLKQGLFRNQTEKKIMYRQEKLSELLMCQNKNNMDYFFIQQNVQNLESPRPNYSPRKYKIGKVNQLITPVKQEKQKQSSIKQAAYHTFNFNKFPLNANLSPKKKSSASFNESENKIMQLIHTMGTRPKSRNSQDRGQQKNHKAVKSARSSRRSPNSKIQIDIHNPLFDLAYFQKNRKQMLRLEKQSRTRPLTTPTKSTLKPSSSIKMQRSSIF